ncbi:MULTISPECIES: hypothetical protein [unclassified Paenibacillus]|uniref:hypothetical protein n=1 Tax=unclassified Paenibacillus TaxID=185978 RepID=UPI0027D8EEE0|nr:MULTISPECIES: hypothetical protein [unclassified Paenibacillus]
MQEDVIPVINKVFQEWIILLPINPWITLLIGAAGGQIINHTIIQQREKKKEWRDSKYKFYWPLYVAINQMFETTTAYRPDRLKKSISRLDQNKAIFEIFDKNIEYANADILVSYYEFEKIRLYEDVSNDGWREELKLYFKVLKYFYIYSLEKKEIKLDDTFFKSSIIFFGMWQLALVLELDDIDGAMGSNRLIDKDKLSVLYSINDLEKALSYSKNKKKEFLVKLLKDTVKESHFEEVYSRYFTPGEPWDNPSEIYLISLRREIIEGVADGKMPIYHRESLRIELLEKIYNDLFYTRENQHIYKQNEYNNLFLEKKEAYEYLKDKNYIQLIREESLEHKETVIKFKITAAGMEKIEELHHELFESK